MTRVMHFAPPKASAMIESLRGLGYSLETAVADTIDNSISARATEVSIQFKWSGTQSYITIYDNGHGMSRAELQSAMRLGERNPLDSRTDGDLGRFGLGMKTAAFSQARCLTVASRDASLDLACFSWDLDVLASARDGAWYLLEGPNERSFEALSQLRNDCPGTLVVWEVLDRLIPTGTNEKIFLDAIDRVEKHLSMVFHRFLEGSRPRLRININDVPVKPWNPFLVSSTAPSWSSPIESLRTHSGDCAVQCHVLPHRDRLSAAEFDAAAGISGWNAQQGFYVYRNDRLLVAGSWLGLGNPRPWVKDEIHRLARIRIDFASRNDSDWKIDIRKSIAQPPHQFRQRLVFLAEDTRSRARAVYAHRGVLQSRGSEPAHLELWQSVPTAQGVKYRINRSHPIVQSLVHATSPTEVADNALRLVEDTIPVQRIWLDAAEQRNVPEADVTSDDEAIRQMLRVFYGALLAKGYLPKEARECLLRTDPFIRFPALISELGDDSVSKDTN